MARFGNTSVSSLLSAAKAAYNKKATLEDSIAAYEYDLSPKTQSDLKRYTDHLQGRIGYYQNVDPSKALSYQKNITSAQRSYTSAEINRATTQVMYGNQSDGDKLNTMIGLYQRALESGDQNLAQNIEMKAAILQQQMQKFSGGRGFGGSGSAKDPQVEGFKESKKDYQNYVDHLDQELRSGHISAKEYMMGGVDKKTGKPFTGLRDTLQQLEGVRQSAYDYAQKTGNQDAINFYGDLSNTMKSDRYQNFINQAGAKIDAGQVPGARQYNYNTGQWEFKPNKAEGGYVNTPLGAAFKMKDSSNDNIVGTDASGLPIWLPKNQMNQITEIKDGNSTKLGQYTGYLPGRENTPTSDYFGTQANLNELTFNQDNKGQVSGITPTITTIDPRTGQFFRDPVTGETRQPTIADFGATGTLSDNPLIGGVQQVTNAIVDPLVKDIKDSGVDNPLNYGKKKVSDLLGKVGINQAFRGVLNQAKSLGMSNPLAHLSMNGGGFNPIGAFNDLKTRVGTLQKQVDAKNAADAAQRAAQFAADQARINAANQAALQKQIQSSKLSPQLKNTVLAQSSPMLTSQVGSAAFNNKYLGQVGKLYNGAL